MTPRNFALGESAIMYKIFLIGLGGFTGALLRYGVSGLVQNWSKSVSFPYGTLAVNLVGCFLIGLFSQLADSYGVFSSEIRGFVFIGILGAFTTYSTFGNETFNLLREGETFLSFANIGLHLILGLGAIWLGRIMVISLWR
jgi:CrcB protein